MVERESNGVGKKIIVGVCVMEKKVFSAPMGQILERLQAFGEFEIVYFGDKVILEEPIERPYLVNELEPQHLLHDRRKVYECLEMCGIPVPRYAFVNRDKPDQELDYFVEEEDFVEVRGQRFWKPFVEKPVHGDDHRIMIYYPSSAGGGMKELFRKVGNRSSEFHPDVRRVRREGSYIYEEFMPTGGTDVKVNLEDPERYRLEMTFSRGADLSPLEKTDIEAASLHQEHTLPIMGPERLQEAGEYLTLDKMEDMVRPFAMPAEDFPPPSTRRGSQVTSKVQGCWSVW